MAKNFIVQNLENSISKTNNARTKTIMKDTLAKLKSDKGNAEEICYKFLGDNMYEKIFQFSQVLLHSKVPNSSKPAIKESTLPLGKTNRRGYEEHQPE